MFLFLCVWVLFIKCFDCKSCENPVPGIGRMSRGIDITTLDLFPTDLSFSNGFRSQIFELSCNGNKRWSHPAQTTISYQVPDQVDAINTVPGGAMNINTQMHHDLDQYKRQLAHKVGLNGGMQLVGTFSGSPSYQLTQEQILKSNKTAIETFAHISALQIDFTSDLSKLTLNGNFKRFVEQKLIGEYDEHEEIYEEFLNKFGTHYFEMGTFGGYLHQKMLIQNDYIYRTEPRVITANIEASFLGVVGVKPDSKVNRTFNIQEFETNTDSTFYYYGGMTDLRDKKDEGYFSKWGATVLKDPWLFGGQVRNIEQLIDDEAVARQVHKAVQIRRARAYFNELKNSLEFSAIQFSETDQERITDIENGLFAPERKPRNVTLLISQIEHYFKIFHRIKDRFLLQELLGRMAPIHEIIVPCKHLLSMVCNSPSMNSYAADDFDLRHLFYKIALLYEEYSRPDYVPRREQIEKIKEKVIHILQTHWNQRVELCDQYEPCVECLRQIQKREIFQTYQKCFTSQTRNLIKEFHNTTI